VRRLLRLGAGTVATGIEDDQVQALRTRYDGKQILLVDGLKRERLRIARHVHGNEPVAFAELGAMSGVVDYVVVGSICLAPKSLQRTDEVGTVQVDLYLDREPVRLQ